MVWTSASMPLPHPSSRLVATVPMDTALVRHQMIYVYNTVHGNGMFLRGHAGPAPYTCIPISVDSQNGAVDLLLLWSRHCIQVIPYVLSVNIMLLSRHCLHFITVHYAYILVNRFSLDLKLEFSWFMQYVSVHAHRMCSTKGLWTMTSHTWTSHLLLFFCFFLIAMKCLIFY